MEFDDSNTTNVVNEINWSNVQFVVADGNEQDPGPLNGYIEISGEADLGELGAIELGSDND